MIYSVRMTEFFEKQFHKIIPKNKQQDILKRMNELSRNPYIGKPLGSKFMRELKLDKYRVYFLVYEEEVLILFVAVSDKKDQQNTINTINQNKDIYYKFVKNLKDSE